MSKFNKLLGYVSGAGMVLGIIYSMTKGEFIIALFLATLLYFIWINPSFNPKNK